MKINWSGIAESISANKGKLIAIALGLVLLVGVIFWISDSYGTWSFGRGQNKAKEQIANTAKEIANIQTEIANLENRKSEKQGELKRDTEALSNSLFGLEEAKKETNAAIANFQKAVNNNSNVNRSLEDLDKVLEKLEQ